jgi:hypothetical protein
MYAFKKQKKKRGNGLGRSIVNAQMKAKEKMMATVKAKMRCVAPIGYSRGDRCRQAEEAEVGLGDEVIGRVFDPGHALQQDLRGREGQEPGAHQRKHDRRSEVAGEELLGRVLQRSGKQAVGVVFAHPTEAEVDQRDDQGGAAIS